MKIRFFLLFLCLTAIHSLAQQAQLMIPTTHVRDIDVVSFSGDDKFFFTRSYSDGIKIWNSDDLRLVKNLQNERPISILVPPNDSKSVLFVGSKQISWFDMDKFDVSRTLVYDSIRVTDAVISPDGNYLYLCGEPKVGQDDLVVWRLGLKNGQWEKICQLEKPKGNRSLDNRNFYINNKGTELLVCGWLKGAYLIDIKSKSLIKLFPYEDFRVNGFTPNGNLLDIKGTYTPLTFKVIDRSSFSVIKEYSIPIKGAIHNYLRSFAWSKTNPNNLLFITNEALHEVNTTKGQLVRTNETGGKWQRYLTLNFSGSKILTGVESMIKDPRATLYEAKSFNMIGKVGSNTFSISDISTYPSALKFATASSSGLPKTIELKPSGLTISTEKPGRPSYETASNVAVASTGIHAALSSTSFEWVIQYDAKVPYNNLEKNYSGFTTGAIKSLFYSPDGSRIASVGTRAYVMNATTGRTIRRFDNSDLGILATGKFGAISTDNELIVFLGEKSMGDKPKKNMIQCFRISTGQKLWEKPILASEFQFRENNKIISCLVNGSNPALLQLDAATGEVRKFTSLLNLGNFNSVTTSRKGDFYFFTDSKSKIIKQYRYPTGEKVAEFEGTFGRIGGLEVLAGDEFLVSEVLEGGIELWDIKLKKMVARLYLFNDSDDWVILDPKGRFDASPQAMSKLYYTKNKTIIPLEAVYEAYYTPLLLARILKHIELPPPAVTAINIPPIVKLKYAETQRNLTVDDDEPTYQNTTGSAEIIVTATAIEDKVDEIRLFHNGKIVTLTSRNLIVADADNSTTVTKKYNINLLPGVNSIRALALNSQRTESRPDNITINYKNSNTPVQVANPAVTGNGVIAAVDKTATLHLIVVGINAYDNKSMALNYALADASAFKTEIEKDAKSVIANIKTYFVTDKAADRNGILTAFKEVQQTAKAQDVFVFYYAGHGVIGQDKEFYLVPRDVSDLKNVQAELQQKAIPSKLLQQYAIDIAAQKQLFILDACQSAGAFEKMLSESSEQQKSIAVVARSTGTHWMAASGAQQFANEFSSLGHGAFTYVLLKALKGEAAKNKMITVNGLKNFLQQGIPALMKKYNGAEQYPASYGFGNDFPVEMIR